jgi:non-heme Fe2+,alpha-ketoglutarate-dependent halogenase
MCAPLVRGEDAFGHFERLPPPEGEFHPAALARHDRAYRLYRENYAEQIAAHDAAFTTAAAN